MKKFRASARMETVKVIGARDEIPTILWCREFRRACDEVVGSIRNLSTATASRFSICQVCRLFVNHKHCLPQRNEEELNNLD